MTLPPVSQRSLTVAPGHLESTRKGIASLLPLDDVLLIDNPLIDELAGRSGDTYLWHVEAGSSYRESSLLRERMEEARIDPAARLAHGALGLIYALRVAYAQSPERPILAICNVRYSVPVFVGAHLTVAIDRSGANGAETFVVATDQFDPKEAITGRVVHTPLPVVHDPAFTSLAEQQEFSLEECIGAVSALIGLWVQESGSRVLYMSQNLELQAPVTLGQTLEAKAEIVGREPRRRGGERITAQVTVRDAATGAPIAHGDSLFLHNDEPI